MADGSGLRPLAIQVRTPLDPATLNARMARNDARMLPEAVRAKTCIIVGSGPSARHGALWERLEREPLPTFAVNGALKLFMQHGMAPDYWTCCDPQECVTDFVPIDAPITTTYLLATKCPDSLFQQLRTHRVRTWRLDDLDVQPGQLAMPTAVSITLVTMNLARMMGFHRFEVYGWDCCYLDGEHHASAQPEPEQPIDFTIEHHGPDAVAALYQSHQALYDRHFKVCGAWIAELNDARIQANNYGVMGYTLNVHGPGAVASLLRANGLIA